MSLVVEFPFDVAEHRRASVAVMRMLPARWTGPILALAFLTMGLWPVARGWGEARALSLLAGALPWMVLAVPMAFLSRITIWQSSRKLLRIDPSIRGTQRRSVDAAGFHSSGNGVAVDLPWHAMARCVETDDFFLFFYTPHLAYYLGKTRLSADDCSVIRGLMAAHASAPVPSPT